MDTGQSEAMFTSVTQSECQMQEGAILTQKKDCQL